MALYDANGNINWSLAGGTLLATTAIGAGFGYLSGRNIKSALKSQARIAEMNADIERASAERDIRYYNEKAAREGWTKNREMESVKSSQNVAMAASGFVSQSSGDKRLLKDTEAKYAEQERLANRELYLMSFERMRKAELSAIELRSKADQLRIQGKYAPLSSTLSGAAQGLSTGTQWLSLANTFFKNPNVAKQTPATANGDFKFYENTPSTASWEDVYKSDPTSNLLKELNNSSLEFFNYGSK